MKHAHKVYPHVLQQPLFYEARPYVALFVGAVGVVHAHYVGSWLSLFSGVILIACGALVLGWRKQHRE